ncbi:MAG: hypothetical protein LBH44_06420 [Treponema sp.]|jgi:hypothetical protein|nr:hypothetical protein [Treponema sp.]
MKKEKRKMKKSGRLRTARKHTAAFFTLFTVLCSLFTVACELFTGPKVDLLKKIDDEVAWANAEKLAVTVVFPAEWGQSPQQGTDKCGDTRRGYEFNVEFTPFGGYGFEEWLAFKTDDYNGLDKTKSAGEVRALSLNGNGVDITEDTSATGAKTAKVRINILIPVTLVPWCGNRPRLSQRTNPPLNPLPAPFPFDQKVNLWFTMPVKQSTVAMGETIRITGIYAGGNNRGELFQGNGDLNNHFTMEFPAADHIRLTPKTAIADELALLSITVTVGPGIESNAGVQMAAAETVTYQTDASEAQKVYEPGIISARQTPPLPSPRDNWFQDAGTQWNNPNIDRRFNQSDNKTVQIKFAVDSVPEGAPATPNRITIVERLAHDLGGLQPQSLSTLETIYDVPGPGVAIAADYTITHTLKTTEPGIIRLVALPWYDNTFPPLQLHTALTDGQYVTIVMDTAAPDLSNMGASLSGYGSVSGGVHVYGANDAILTLANLSNLNDNGGFGGIRAAQAWSLPWTMDDTNALKWYVQIQARSGGAAVEKGPLNVYNVSTLNNTYNLKSNFDFSADTDYRVNVRFEDRMGNQSAWKDTGLFLRYSTAQINAVTNLAASCNTSGNSITVTWAQPASSNEVVIRTYRSSATGDVLENETRQVLGSTAVSHSFSVTPMNEGKGVNGVRSGNAVNGVYGYEISVIAHNIAGTAVTGPIWVYNIPGMSSAGLTRIENSGQLAVNSGGNFVLTRDITVASHNPTGTFTGKFYGNGHTITINGMAAAADMGLFAVMGGSAFIRDLTVNYSGSITGPASASRFGGIAGTTQGNAEFLNVLVKGAATFNVNGNNTAYTGGMAGRMLNTSKISNAYGGMNLTVNRSGTETNALCVGGIAGIMEGTEPGVNVTEVNAAGSIRVTSGGTGDLYFGGFCGQIKTAVIEDCGNTSSITLSSHSGAVYMGGFAGGLDVVNSVKAELKRCWSKGDIQSGGNGKFHIGGLLGHSQGVSTTVRNLIEQCWSTGNINAVSTGEWFNVGGLVGYLSLTNVSECWAGGSVTARRTANGPIDEVYAGGFASMANGSSITNCYALGNVEVNKETTTNNGGGLVSAGGFVGVLRNSSNAQYCFATGMVTAARRDTGSNYLYAGGFLGLIRTETEPTNNFENSAALGKSVTAKGGSQQNIGRIYGGFLNSPTRNANYARDDMRIEVSNVYTTISFPYWDGTGTRPLPSYTVNPSTTGTTTANGASAAASAFYSSSIWTGSLGFNNDATNSPAGTWNMNTVAARGYPILMNVGGQ